MYAYVHAPTDYTASNSSVEICRVRLRLSIYSVVIQYHLRSVYMSECGLQPEGVCERRLATGHPNIAQQLVHLPCRRQTSR
ncbi:hypothetical protein BD410DRAFT_188923 [Rickenella mellea]|uniref:Uncharacterized protein n=1 Tax=Rickenella mellea TaxID=50990 RepID=A0A4Y7Q6Y4_9AGAM|nr:hypothetical protein BD410DRAFT_188923 [Rickenella mellea]